jgi:hypothetical protein
MDKNYTLEQVFRSPDGSAFTTTFDTYATYAEARKAAREHLGNSKWVIVEHKIVKRSET